MSKAKKINFELDEQLVERAQAFALRRGVSLTKLVGTFFASLGQEREATSMPSTTQKMLAEVAVGKASLADAARELGLQDAGFLLHMMREEGLPLPALEASVAKAQAQASFDALQSCLLPEKKGEAKKARRKRPATA
jgi:hypothetical protein